MVVDNEGRFSATDGHPENRLPAVAASALVALGLIAGFLMREPLSDVFAQRVHFNAVGLSAVAALTLVVVGGFTMSLRATGLSPGFRGAIGEIVRLVAGAEVCFMTAIWVTIIATDAY